MSVSLIPPEAFDFVASDMERHLAASIERSGGRESIGTVWSRLFSGQYQLWMFFDENDKAEGALITRIEHYPLKKLLNLIFIGGTNIEDWHEDLLDVLERFAKNNDCAGLETVGRFGWKKFLQKYGWEANHVICEKIFDVVEVEQEKQDVA